MDFAGFGNLPLFRYLDHKPVASIEESSYEMGEEPHGYYSGSSKKKTS
jgi:hypothetical protein